MKSMKKVILLIISLILISTVATRAGEIHDAIVQSDKSKIESLLAENPELIDSKDRSGLTPLFIALDRGRNNLASYLLNKGADPNLKGYLNRTYLHMAARSGNLTVANLLIGKGADVNAKDSKGETPLQCVGRAMRTELISLLVKNGALVNVNDKDDVPLIHDEIIAGHTEAVNLLLVHGIDTEIREPRYNRTALHWAAIKGNFNVTDKLLNSGANVNAEDNYGNSPIYYASKYGHKDIGRLLEAKGDVHDGITDNFGRNRYLDQNLNTGEAVLWYLGHCGWAIKTSNHLLVFDYFNTGTDPSEPLLANGHLNSNELAGLVIFVFVTHGHYDHFDRSIYNLKDKIRNVTYIYGFNPETNPIDRRSTSAEAGYSGPEYMYIGPHQDKKIGQLEVITIESNDAGVGFLVKVDGVNIYHAGDHAGFRDGERVGFTREIDYLAEHVASLDFAFVNVTGCHTQCASALADGTDYTLQKLSPKFWFPTHAGEQEYIYREFAEKVGKEIQRRNIICAENRGDCFVYKSGQIQ
jgi:ankyrin repeat protein/L-ascorbate metabolism protein UlaG (beta-lactamase superfamily)